MTKKSSKPKTKPQSKIPFILGELHGISSAAAHLLKKPEYDYYRIERVKENYGIWGFGEKYTLLTECDTEEQAKFLCQHYRLVCKYEVRVVGCRHNENVYL